ncbi:MAG: sugar phosphate isomerase/epimerase family protein [Bacteroidales bacterium]
MKRKYAAILGNLGNTCDRFLSSGYKHQPGKEEMVRRAASIKDVTGIELVGTWDIDKDNQDVVKSMLKDNDLKCVSIIPDIFGQSIWGNGSFTSRDHEIRKKAVCAVKDTMDIAENLNCKLINIWPGQDGYDYPFQGDFTRAQQWMVNGIREVADYNPDIKIALEYKIKEPRTHSYLATAANTLILALEVDRENVGVCIDFGHALMAYENVAESVAMLMRHDKLFHMHFNDNYRYWDDDMVAGSIHSAEYFELIYWLRKLNYEGWFSMDLYPYREDAGEAIEESIAWLKLVEERIEAKGDDFLSDLIQHGNATRSTREMRKLLTNS